MRKTLDYEFNVSTSRQVDEEHRIVVESESLEEAEGKVKMFFLGSYPEEEYPKRFLTVGIFRYPLDKLEMSPRMEEPQVA